MELDERQLCDVELLMQGGFSPLTGFMDEADYKSVVENMHLVNGLIFGLPVVYDTRYGCIPVPPHGSLNYASLVYSLAHARAPSYTRIPLTHLSPLFDDLTTRHSSPAIPEWFPERRYC